MQTRKLGRLTTPMIGLGTLSLTGGYGLVDSAQAARTIRFALEHGVSLIDTADFYAGGAVESLIGDVIVGQRDSAMVATRGGALFTREGRPTGLDCSPAHLRQACDASLRRLRVDRIDLYYLARVDPKVPLEDSVGALADLVAVGKVGCVGLSEASVADLRLAAAVHPITALASEYSLMERGIEMEVLPAARELGIGIAACCPLGRGVLTGRVTSAEQFGEGDYRRNHPRFSPENLPTNVALVRRVQEMATRYDVSLVRLVLAWLLAQGHDIVPIPSTRCATHVEINVASASIVLSGEDLRALSDAVPIGAASGDRLPSR